MELRGEHEFPVPRHELWDALMDPQVLQAAIPGCQDMHEVAPNSYAVTVRVGVAAIRGTYHGTVTMSEADPPRSYRLVASGHGPGGGAEGDARITLDEAGDGTRLRYEAEVHAHGALVRLGSRLILSAARMMSARFFEGVEEQVAGKVSDSR